MREKFEGSSEEESDDEPVVKRGGFRMITQSVGGGTIQQPQEQPQRNSFM